MKSKVYYTYIIERWNEENHMWQSIASYISYIDAKLNFESINTNCIGIYRFIKVFNIIEKNNKIY